MGEPLARNTHLCLWGAPFISNQQQIALSVNNNLFLEAATCHTHKTSRYAGKTEWAEGGETWASLVGKYTPGWRPGGPSEPLGVGFGSASSSHWVLKEPDSDLNIRLKEPDYIRLGRTGSRARPGCVAAEKFSAGRVRQSRDSRSLGTLTQGSEQRH